MPTVRLDFEVDCTNAEVVDLAKEMLDSTLAGDMALANVVLSVSGSVVSDFPKSNHSRRETDR
jgi:hypothetical protein